jgi:hypothetical protein
MATSTININRKIRKYEEKSDVIFQDINDFLDVSNKVKKNIEVLIKLGSSINNGAFSQIVNIYHCSEEQERDFKAIAVLMTLLVGKSQAYHDLFANHVFYKKSLKTTLEKFSIVVAEMKEVADDILTNLQLKYDKEWIDLGNDIEANIGLLK